MKADCLVASVVLFASQGSLVEKAGHVVPLFCASGLAEGAQQEISASWLLALPPQVVEVAWICLLLPPLGP